eukprot:scaffold5081_cov430-Prasinococcus_capsulatus_cf.AAC.9
MISCCRHSIVKRLGDASAAVVSPHPSGVLLCTSTGFRHVKPLTCRSYPETQHGLGADVGRGTNMLLPRRPPTNEQVNQHGAGRTASQSCYDMYLTYSLLEMSQRAACGTPAALGLCWPKVRSGARPPHRVAILRCFRFPIPLRRRAPVPRPELQERSPQPAAASVPPGRRCSLNVLCSIRVAPGVDDSAIPGHPQAEPRRRYGSGWGVRTSSHPYSHEGRAPKMISFRTSNPDESTGAERSQLPAEEESVAVSVGESVALSQAKARPGRFSEPCNSLPRSGV